MRTTFSLKLAVGMALMLSVVVPLAPAQQQATRQVLRADSNWKFMLGDPRGAEASSFVDNSWRTVQLPHDWSIEGAPEKNNPTGSGGGFSRQASVGIGRPSMFRPIGRASG